jgi:transaldolase
VSLEVSPHLAYDAEASIAEGRRLWEQVARPNLMIKVPATGPGLRAIRALTAAGINVNVTLLFSVARYRDVAEAYVAGLELRQLLHGGPLTPVHSVASFFLSRIDTLIDPRLDAIGTPTAAALRGTAAVACASLAYQEYRQSLRSPRWMTLAALGAQPQHLLWASTSTKDKAYCDLKYVESLIAADTINTMPADTLAAFRDHGNPAVYIDDDLENARALNARLASFGIRLDEVAGELQADGVRKFVASYDRLLAALAQRAADFAPPGQPHGHP